MRPWVFVVCGVRDGTVFFFFLRIRRPRRSPLFPYPPLFRSQAGSAAGMTREQNARGAAGPKDWGVVQRGTQPNPAEVRPGNRDGDAPSAAAGELMPRPARR